MPSIRQGLYSAECPLREYELPTVANEVLEVSGQSARAVAYHAGLTGEPAEDLLLDARARDCAQKIMANECPLWTLAGKKAGFHFRS